MFKNFIKALFKPSTSQKMAPPSIDALFSHAFAQHQNGKFEEARLLYMQVLQIQSTHFDAQHLLGVVALQSGNHSLALEMINKAIAIKSDCADAYLNRGAAQMAMRKFSEAVASCDQAIVIEPDNSNAYSNRGNALTELKQYEAAVASCERAIALQPENAEAHLNRGAAMHELEKYGEAVLSYNRALEIMPDYAEAFSNRGNALQKLGNLDAAIASFRRAIAKKPDFLGAHHNLAYALLVSRKFEAAIASSDTAVRIRPDYAEAYYIRGIAQQGLGLNEAAVASYNHAVSLRAEHADAWNNRGAALQDLRMVKMAVQSFDRALALAPNYDFLCGSRWYARTLLCDWEGLQQGIHELEQKIERREKAAVPFAAVVLTTSSRLQQIAARTWVQEKQAPIRSLGTIDHKRPSGKIRLGYFSADFHSHPVSFLMAELFEIHDRELFEVYAFSFGPDSNDDMRLRLIGAFDQFIEVRSKTDEEVAALAKNIGIDIAIDLGGHTKDNRFGIFAHRAAPLQVNYLGFPGTTGAPYMDYLVADKVVIPEAQRNYFDENIVYLPNSYMVNDSTKVISTKRYTRGEMGLPELGFVFCCFHNYYKISPQIFEIWMRILHLVDGSVLWLSQGDADAVRNLQSAAQTAGISTERIIFAQNMPSMAEHLARLRLADLFLDTLPYNAHTTASDALWVGLPVLTSLGEAFAGRVAASLLTALCVPELITKSLSEYETVAVELARQPQNLQAVRDKIAANQLTTALFDTRRFASNLEAAYRLMVSRYQAGEPSAVIVVQEP